MSLRSSGATNPVLVVPASPHAGRQDDLAALEVAGRVGQLGGVHPADDALEVAADHDLEVEPGYRKQLADTHRHWMIL